MLISCGKSNGGKKEENEEDRAERERERETPLPERKRGSFDPAVYIDSCSPCFTRHYAINGRRTTSMQVVIIVNI